MKIYFLGPFGTNSDLAARHIFKETQYNFIPLRSIEDIFEKVALSHAYYGVIPFENSQNIALKNQTRTKLIIHQNIGHYKMLWNDNVIENILKFLKKE